MVALIVLSSCGSIASQSGGQASMEKRPMHHTETGFKNPKIEHYLRVLAECGIHQSVIEHMAVFFIYLTSNLNQTTNFLHGLDYYGSFLAIKNNYISKAVYSPSTIKKKNKKESIGERGGVNILEANSLKLDTTQVVGGNPVSVPTVLNVASSVNVAKLNQSSSPELFACKSMSF